jgi:SagB-type dehydrogenase family enzyme
MPPIDILKYHQETKHHRHRMARSPEYLDWQKQPNPFRYYQGTDRFNLPFLKKDPELSYQDLYTPVKAQACPLDLNSLAAFLELSLALSAWKATLSHRWSLRINPSSGNLHPTEAHLILPPTIFESAAIFHYTPFRHALELRAVIPKLLWKKITAHFQSDGFLIALTSIFWREAWKYGERAFRYCQHDLGHALGCLNFAARINNWSLTCLFNLSDQEIQTLIGIDRIQWEPTDQEHPDILCWISPTKTTAPIHDLPSSIIKDFRLLSFSGEANALSPSSIVWDVVEAAAQASQKPRTATVATVLKSLPQSHVKEVSISATKVIRNRRSALNYDGTKKISAEQFFAIIEKTLTYPNSSLFNMLPDLDQIDLLLFIFLVQDLAPGLYFLIRNEAHLPLLKSTTRPEYYWKKIHADLPLYHLAEGDFRIEAIEACCFQEIAGFSAFSLGMIAPLPRVVKTAPYRYRRLFWEAGIIGQVLYLGAEAHGLRGTGIGCYFDDEVHDLIGFKDNSFQSLYHFTIGYPIDDQRLTTLPAYHHLDRTS